MTLLLWDPGFCAGHDLASHPENARRLDLVRLPEDWPRIPPRPATDEELHAVHAPGYVALVGQTAGQPPGMLDPDTYHGPDSEAVSRGLAGGLVDLSLAVWRGEHPDAFMVARPPGHHATPDRPMGFCLYNHIAVAAAAVRRAGAEKVAILDFDVHHGNGTEEIFAADPTVLFVSSHQFPHYPGTGLATERGHGAGEGFTINHPLAAGNGDEAFLAAWRDHLLPAVADFGPEMLLVSAGYDAHAADPLAQLEVTTAGFATLVDLILGAADRLCGGRIVFNLEGGYDPRALAECVAATADLLDRRSG